MNFNISIWSSDLLAWQKVVAEEYLLAWKIIQSTLNVKNQMIEEYVVSSQFWSKTIYIWFDFIFSQCFPPQYISWNQICVLWGKILGEYEPTKILKVIISEYCDYKGGAFFFSFSALFSFPKMKFVILKGHFTSYYHHVSTEEAKRIRTEKGYRPLPSRGITSFNVH